MKQPLFDFGEKIILKRNGSIGSIGIIKDIVNYGGDGWRYGGNLEGQDGQFFWREDDVIVLREDCKKDLSRVLIIPPNDFANLANYVESELKKCKENFDIVQKMIIEMQADIEALQNE